MWSSMKSSPTHLLCLQTPPSVRQIGWWGSLAHESPRSEHRSLMPISPSEFLEMERRTRKARGEVDRIVVPAGAVLDEIPLHNEIIKDCNAHWPKWKYIHANPSEPSGIQTGAPDFPIIYLPGGKFIIVECKAKGGKLRPEQLAFKVELEMIGHRVHVVYSMDDYRAALREQVVLP